MSYDVERVRALFPVCRRYVYLDHAGVAPCSARARDAARAWLDDLAERGVRGFPAWEESLASARARAARLLGARPEEIAFTRSTSHGLSLVAQGLDWREGDEVLVCSELEYPSNVYPWQQLERRGVRARELAPDRGGVSPEAVERALTSRTRLVAVSSVQFATGRATDLEALGAICARHGALFAVDGIQSVGAFPLDVKRAGIHFLSADSHKWMLGMVGIGVFFIDASVLDRVRPVLVGWRTTEEAWAFDGSRFEMRRDARKFEEGSLPHPLVDGLDQALAILEEVGIEEIAAHIRGLLARAAGGLERLGCEVEPPAPQRAGILLFTPPRGQAAELCEELTEAGFTLSLRRGRIRISPHLYNTKEEIDRLVEHVERYADRKARQ